MKKVISIICITLLVALYSCDERDDLRSDIDDLTERVANLEASIEQMNSDISNYQQMVEGKILVVGYSKDEQDNYTIELSNGAFRYDPAGNTVTITPDRSEEVV